MSGAEPSLRAATAADFQSFYGHAPPRRARALVVEDGKGRVLGIGGVEHHGALLKAFMDVAPGVAPGRHRRVLIRAVRRVLAEAEATGLGLLAVRDTGQPQSENFLSHFGFARSGAADQQEIWRWHNS